MKTNSGSLVSPLLTLIFCSSAYVVYIFSMFQNDKNWVAIAALIYFLPLFIDLIEDFEGTNILQKKFFTFTIICLGVGALYLVCLLAYLTISEAKLDGTPAFVFKFFLSVAPIVCIPIKAYPVCITLMQRYRKLFP